MSQTGTLLEWVSYVGGKCKLCRIQRRWIASYGSKVFEHKCKRWGMVSRLGCSNHMLGTKDWLFDFDDNFRESVKLGDDSKKSVMWKGNMKLFRGGMIWVITSLYYLHGLRNNLLSIGQLHQKNLTVVFKKDNCKVYHDERGMIMSTQLSTNIMFIIYAPTIV